MHECRVDFWDMQDFLLAYKWNPSDSSCKWEWGIKISACTVQCVGTSWCNLACYSRSGRISMGMQNMNTAETVVTNILLRTCCANGHGPTGNMVYSTEYSMCSLLFSCTVDASSGDGETKDSPWTRRFRLKFPSLQALTCWSVLEQIHTLWQLPGFLRPLLAAWTENQCGSG